MIPTERRVRLLRQALACATLALLTTGCGGGGGGAAAPDSGGVSPTESSYLLAEFVATDSNNQAVRVWDPAQPAVAVQNVKLAQANGIAWTSSHLVFSDATTYDPATRIVTTLGHAKVFYDNGGKLYAIDLRGGQSHAPVQLSSAADVFLPASATSMDAAGDDAWIDAQGGSHHWAIRTTMTATAAPVAVQQIVAPLRDAATGLPRWFFAALGVRSGTHTVPTTYEIADASFAPVDIPAVAAMAAGDGWAGADPAQPGLGYLRIANGLYELRWSDSAVDVDATRLYTFASLAMAPPVADAQSLYVNDGSVLLSLADGVPRTVGSFSIAPTALMDAGSYVAGVEATGLVSAQVDYQVETLDKTGGALTLLANATTTIRLLAASDRGLVLAGTLEQPQAFVLASGDNATRTTLGAQWVGVVRAASGRVDQPAAPVALLSCAAGSTDFCASGALAQLDFSGDSIALGMVATGAAMLRGDAIAGVVGSLSGQTLLATVGGFGDQETDGRDAWQVRPGSVGSLARVTGNLP